MQMRRRGATRWISARHHPVRRPLSHLLNCEADQQHRKLKKPSTHTFINTHQHWHQKNPQILNKSHFQAIRECNGGNEGVRFLGLIATASHLALLQHTPPPPPPPQGGKWVWDRRHPCTGGCLSVCACRSARRLSHMQTGRPLLQHHRNTTFRRFLALVCLSETA